MDTVTRTFPLNLNSSYTANSIIELCHFRDMTFDDDERIGIYLEAFFCNMSLKSFTLGIYPNFDGDESESEKMALFSAAEAKSQKIGLRILTRKNNTGNWDEIAEIILVNRGRKDYFDLLQPYLAKNSVSLLEKNDALGLQLLDYGNGLLKVDDFIKVKAAFSVVISKKNNLALYDARLATIETAIQNYLTQLLPGNLLGRDSTTGTVQLIPQNRFATPAMLNQAIIDLVGGAPGALNTLIELATALNNDANFATTIANQLATINTAIKNINAVQTLTLTSALNITANTWFTVGQFFNAGISSVVALYAVTVNVQYGNGTNTYGHWQYGGGGLLSSIQWKYGGVQLSTTFKIESHNGNDFNCSVRFNLTSINRSLQILFDTSIFTENPTSLSVSLKRIM